MRNFLCSCLWLEVHTHYSQLSLLLRHALSFLSVTKLSQPASPAGLSCLGDSIPSREQQLASLTHTFMESLPGYSNLPWHKAVGSAAQSVLAHRSNNLGNWGMTPLHTHAALISHRVLFRFTGAILFLTVFHGTGLNQMENPG